MGILQFSGKKSKPNAPLDKFERILYYACSRPHVDCKPIFPSGQCFEPNTGRGHGSFFLNYIYRVYGVCEPNFGTTVKDDPSYGDCHNI
ncbi:hypothetical protein CDL12_20362 [Handroanthus impetiginosus]|uniref:X8 domain-containing protein n=1 Tax=Handroanthus impetiginosus TaxID=429701 RepID=A0A2G9GP84_9LAMI|nr:hypothetical protein CDL12_20362 [Handroanthus impetiginosus]